MAVKPVPRQPDFTIEREDLGRIILEDGTTIETRFVLADIVIMHEDIMGPQLALGHVVAIRPRSPFALIAKFKDKTAVPEMSIPLTVEAGFEPIKIQTVEKPTISVYHFEKYVLTLELSISSAARNNNFKIPSGGPVYNIRWTLKYSVS